MDTPEHDHTMHTQFANFDQLEQAGTGTGSVSHPMATSSSTDGTTNASSAFFKTPSFFGTSSFFGTFVKRKITWDLKTFLGIIVGVLLWIIVILASTGSWSGTTRDDVAWDGSSAFARAVKEIKDDPSGRALSSNEHDAIYACKLIKFQSPPSFQPFPPCSLLEVLLSQRTVVVSRCRISPEMEPNRADTFRMSLEKWDMQRQ